MCRTLRRRLPFRKSIPPHPKEPAALKLRRRFLLFFVHFYPNHYCLHHYCLHQFLPLFICRSFPWLRHPRSFPADAVCTGPVAPTDFYGLFQLTVPRFCLCPARVFLRHPAQRPPRRHPLVLREPCPCLPAGTAAGEPPSRVVSQLVLIVMELAGLVPDPDAKRKADLV